MLHRSRSSHPRPSFKIKFAASIMIISLLGGLGGNWVVLQSYAWGKMLFAFAKSDNISTAVAKTFDGNHPCSRCKKIAKARQSESNSLQTLSTSKIDWAYFISKRAAPSAQINFIVLQHIDHNGVLLQFEKCPPTPPPRSLS